MMCVAIIYIFDTVLCFSTRRRQARIFTGTEYIASFFYIEYNIENSALFVQSILLQT